ncbi:MAG: hypothetical protein JW751_00535 [Polyangiaceae bacterium]|nr:hypothetical protein [Polyangiaceae bacterium]
MSVPGFVIELRDGLRRFRRGAVLSGVIRPGDAELSGATLAVLWYTEGKGERDEGIVYLEDLEGLSRDVAPDGSLRLPFRVILPLWPVTYHGQIVKIHWQVAVRRRAAPWRIESEELPFEVIP